VHANCTHKTAGGQFRSEREKTPGAQRGYIIEFEQFDSVWSVQPHSSTAVKEKVSVIYCSDSLALRQKAPALGWLKLKVNWAADGQLHYLFDCRLNNSLCIGNEWATEQMRFQWECNNLLYNYCLVTFSQSVTTGTGMQPIFSRTFHHRGLFNSKLQAWLNCLRFIICCDLIAL